MGSDERDARIAMRVSMAIDIELGHRLGNRP